ncbi:MAG: hypothetical protein C4K49_12010 [Candidatus Thorarchaeota archaeon]|nr:MAG: hypothetical protein C4K49_12010 [Candidatus Thorarchaeota archaeon]
MSSSDLYLEHCAPFVMTKKQRPLNIVPSSQNFAPDSLRQAKRSRCGTHHEEERQKKILVAMEQNVSDAKPESVLVCRKRVSPNSSTGRILHTVIASDCSGQSCCHAGAGGTPCN